MPTKENILPKDYTEAELFTNPESLAHSRATVLQQALPPGAQARVTMAAAVVEDRQGNRRVVIGTSEPNGYLRPGVKSALQPNESVIQGFGHAEADIIDWANKNGYQVIAVAAGRPICDKCVQAIEGASAIVASPKKSS